MAAKRAWTACGIALLQLTAAALAQDPAPQSPGQIRVDRDPARKFDPYLDLKKSGNGYQDGPVLTPLYSLRPSGPEQAGPDKDLNDYYGAGHTRMTAELRDKVEAMAQHKSVSIGDMTCGVGLSFANCGVPKTPCGFTLGVFDLNSRSSAAAMRDDYAFSILSNHCSF